MRIKDRLYKFIMSIGIIPLMAVMICILFVMMCMLPILVLIDPDFIKMNEDNTDDKETDVMEK